MGTRTYNPSVRVGNWNEDIQLEEDTVKDFLEKRERGELLIQKSADFAAIVLKEARLSVVNDASVHIGDTVQLVNPMAKDRTKYFANIDPRDESCLSVNISASKLLEERKIAGTCQISSSVQHILPVARNTFIIESVDGAPLQSQLHFNQAFCIRTTQDGGNLYLSSDTLSIQRQAKKSRHQEVLLVPERSYLCQWHVISLNPQLRMEMEGRPVPANERVIIVHSKTGQALCIEEAHKVKTMLGFEYEVTATTSLDSHKAEKECNHWIFKSGN
ncbi:cilia- and flagella-associated protein 161-like [Watersipora subatra]|uniref:cilia- and flagella-associated protein 161-like n=1 Tax=Watersipora subatra TaxID=2589382 RepID=UPI00355C412B